MIRPATLHDIPALVALGQRMHAESRYSVLRFNDAKLGATLRQVLDSPTGFLWVATDEQGLTGGLAAIAAPHWCSDDLVSSDLALFMVPEARGGLAPARLVTRYRQWAADLGVVLCDIGVTTGIQTEQTAKLLERLGFTRCGVILES